MSISGLAQAASAPQAFGQINLFPSAFAVTVAGRTPATGASDPSRPSSPTTVKPCRASEGIAPSRHQAKRDRQIVMAAFLGQIGGREIDGDALGGGKGEA
jgi:hypothetical protein